MNKLELIELLKGRISTSVVNLLYYDRKEDEELSPDDVNSLICSGSVTAGDLIEWFANSINTIVKENF